METGSVYGFSFVRMIGEKLNWRFRDGIKKHWLLIDSPIRLYFSAKKCFFFLSRRLINKKSYFMIHRETIDSGKDYTFLQD